MLLVLLILDLDMQCYLLYRAARAKDGMHLFSHSTVVCVIANESLPSTAKYNVNMVDAREALQMRWIDPMQKYFRIIHC